MSIVWIMKEMLPRQQCDFDESSVFIEIIDNVGQERKILTSTQNKVWPARSPGEEKLSQ